MTYKESFIKFMVDCGVLTFGEFTLKSGRKAPYFINCGNYKTGAQLAVVVAAWPPGGHAGPPEEAWKQLSRQAQSPVIICNQTGTEGMDCSHAQSAAVSDGEVLFTYEGEEAVLLMDFDVEKKQVISQAFEVIDFASCKEKNY